MNLRARGFTIIELLVVMAVIGMLLSIAAPRYLQHVDQSRETVLRHNLDGLRRAIDQFHSDKGRYPQALKELVEQRYLYAVPIDPLTARADTWVRVPAPAESTPAWADVHSGSPGLGRDGSLYGSW